MLMFVLLRQCCIRVFIFASQLLLGWTPGHPVTGKGELCRFPDLVLYLEQIHLSPYDPVRIMMMGCRL